MFFTKILGMALVTAAQAAIITATVYAVTNWLDENPNACSEVSAKIKNAFNSQRNQNQPHT